MGATNSLTRTYALKDWLANFGRLLTLLLNRTLMYQVSHPIVRGARDDFMATCEPLLERISPLVFILNRNQFYVDEQVLDPRINVKRILDLFRAVGLQSISFEKGLAKSELDTLCALFSGLTMTSKAEALKAALASRGVFNIKVNHVFYRKVTADDQIVSREALKNVSPFDDAEDPERRRKFMDALLESVLSEELAGALNISQLLDNPAEFSRRMIDADLAGTRRTEDRPGEAGEECAAPAALDRPGEVSPGGSAGAEKPSGTAGEEAYGGNGHGSPRGALLLHQLDRMQQEVQNHLKGNGQANLADLAEAILTMKRHLLEGVQAQKAMGAAYENEAAILARADQLTDGVLVALVRQEYRSGDFSAPRLGLLIRRLIPAADDLRRLLPQIKLGLLAEGMPLSAYLQLLQELQNELQGEDLVRVLEENARAVGLDGGSIIEEIKRNPAQAAELIYLAAEIRREKGDENALSDILVAYVEQLSKDSTPAPGAASDQPDDSHMKQVMSEVQSKVLKQLSRMNVQDDVLQRLEQRLHERMEGIMDRMRVEWLNAHAGARTENKVQPLTLLQTLEQSAVADEEMSAILAAVRRKVDAGDIPENDFSRIHTEIEQQKRRLVESHKAMLPDAVLSAEEFMFILEKEIARCKRYGVPFSALAFSFVTARSRIKALQELINAEAVVRAALEKLTTTFREVDYVGQLGRNKMLVILPMADPVQAKKALNRVMQALHSTPLHVNEVPVNLRVAGVAAAYETECAMDAQAFVLHLSNQLADMVSRIKNIQVLF